MRVKTLVGMLEFGMSLVIFLCCFDCDLMSTLLVVSGKLGEALIHFPELFGWFVVEFV